MPSRTAIATPTDVYPRDGNCINFDIELEDTRWATFSFTNQCDALTFVTKDIYDVTTNKAVGHYFQRNGLLTDGSDNLIYMRGDKFGSRVPVDGFISGRHYKYKITCYTHFIDFKTKNIGLPNPCVPYASGIIEYVRTPSLIIIQKGITKLRQPYYWHEGQDDQVLVGCTYMRIKDEMRMIKEYNSKTGEATLDSPFSNEALSNLKELQYYLCCNYIEDGWYDFYYRDEIESETTITTGNFGLHCSSTYYHPNYIGLEKYRYKVYSKSNADYINGHIGVEQDELELNDKTHIALEKNIDNDIVGKTILIETAKGITTGDYVEKGYSDIITYYDSSTGIATIKSGIKQWIAVDSLYTIQLGSETLIADSGNLLSQSKEADFMVYPYQPMNVTTELTSYEKQFYSTTESIKFTPTVNSPVNSHTVSVNNKNQNVRIDFNLDSAVASNTNYLTHIYRKDNNESLWKIAGFRQQDVTKSIASQDSTFVDYMAGNNRDYQYAIVPLFRSSASANGVRFKPYIIDDVNTKWDGWTITSLMDYQKYVKQFLTKSNFTTTFLSYTKRQHDKKFYKAIETWRFISDINSGDISHNLGLVTHVGTSTFPTVSRTNNNYESGSFTANLLTLECPSGQILDDIEKVERWKRFINGDNLFLLKSDKGDVWVISIAENVSRQYDESTPWVLTKVSYSWVQVEDNDNVIIV